MSIDLVKRAKADLEAALKPLVDTVGLRSTQFGPSIEPPATVVGAPRIVWSGYGTDASEADFMVYVVVAWEGAVDRLLAVVETVVQTIEASVASATVGDVTPSNYAPANLPCYVLPVNVSLS